MPKTVKEEQVKCFRCFLDALMDANFILETIEIEDNNWPEKISSKKMSAECRLKTLHRSSNVLEKIYLKYSE